MRFVSKPSAEGYVVYAVTGVNVISFGIDFTKANTKDLLGFAIERIDPTENQRYFLRSMKFFKEIVPNPTPTTQLSTLEHPIQSFVWDDFTAKPDREYQFLFYPMTGTPKNLKQSSTPVAITVTTEKDVDSANEHDVFFNRGVASSQAYANKFGNAAPDKISDATKRAEAYAWLSRGLDGALVRFIQQAKKGDALRACFYEFHYAPVVDEFAAAIKRGVDVRIITDAKDNESTNKKTGVVTPAFPREANKKAMSGRIPAANRIPRTASKSYIEHNKFVIYLQGAAQTPTSVWTGSTNISEGGIFGQTNVGHAIRNAGVAAKYLAYWELLQKDPGKPADGSAAKKGLAVKDYEAAVVGIEPDVIATRPRDLPAGITCIFSPRPTVDMLTKYATLLDSAERLSCITLAFGVGKGFKSVLSDNTARNPLTFLLLEKEDKPNARSKDPYIKLGAKNNVYEAFGAYLDSPIYNFVRETSTLQMGLNTHVMYVHSKFMLLDPLSDAPAVITGSANFSEASTTENDENMVIIKGNKRVADIYFTEFMRLFNHYYFRSVYATLQREQKQQGTGKTAKATTSGDSVFLIPDATWLDKYKPGALRRKRLEMFTMMKP